MKLFKILPLILVLGILFSSCAKIFYSSDAKELASSQSTIAILPPIVSIAANRNVKATAIIEQQKIESMNFHKEMYAWILKRKMQGKITPEIQDLEITIARLKDACYPETISTPEEICDILGVDGILGSYYSLSKPMSQDEAIVFGVLFDVWGPTNEVAVTLSIKDCANKKLIWNYDHVFSGTVGSSPEYLVNRLMRHASKKMPYRIK